MQGPFLMSGYYKAPEKTQEAFQEGWLKTGDQGYLDEDGFLYLTGRIKDTFKTTKGKFIAPTFLEWMFSGNHNIEQSCVVGHGCPQPMLLIVLSELGKAKPKATIEQDLTHALTIVNKELPNYKKLSTIVIVEHPWTVENGKLTPTLKVKRPIIHQSYQSRLQDWHEERGTIVWEK